MNFKLLVVESVGLMLPALLALTGVTEKRKVHADFAIDVTCRFGN